MQQANTSQESTTQVESSTHKNLTERRRKLNDSERTTHKVAADILRTLEILADQHNPELVEEAAKIANTELDEAIQ